MAQRIAKVTTRGVSVWDVHVQVKEGLVEFSGSPWPGKLSQWLGWLLNDRKPGPVPADLTWDESLRQLLVLFQKHNVMDRPSTVFDGVPMLHFLKFSLLRKKNDAGDLKYFFCFSTQFDDPTEDEQLYMNVMYSKYGALMEVIWSHCEGFTQLLDKPPSDAEMPVPPDPAIDTASYALSEDFLKLVDASNVDRDKHLCFYNSNRDVTSENVKDLQADSEHLYDVKEAAIKAQEQLGQNVPCQEVITTLLDVIQREE